MAYTIPYTDEPTNGSIVVIDGTLNTETTLKLPGRNYTGYGGVIAENFLHLLENFSNSIEPPRPVEGQLWYDTSPGNEQLKVYDGTGWVPAGGLNKANSAPDVTRAQPGDLWADVDNQQLYINSGSGWVLVGPSFADGLSTGVSPRTITGADNVEYTVVVVEIRAQIIAIYSDFEINPNPDIPGFDVIRPGFNLSSLNITGDGSNKIYGVSEKAESLIVNNVAVDASNFLRSDVTSTTAFPINIQNDGGMLIGVDANFGLSVEGQASIIQNRVEGSNIDLRVRSGGSSQTVIRVDSTRRVGINNESPDEALDVAGNIKTDSSVLIDGLDQSTSINTGSIVTKGGVGIAKNLNVGGQSQFSDLTTFANVIPDGNNTRNLGSASSQWQNVYATQFVGRLVGNVTGTVIGNAEAADRLTSGTTFSLTGDVASDNVVFDGQTGGSNKVFNTTINSDFIASKELTQTSLNTDEVIINRTTGNTGLYKVSVRDFFERIPVNPPGVIMPYAGNTAPAGWLLCDGSEYSQAEFGTLFNIIGYAFGSRNLIAETDAQGRSLAQAGLFKVPDLRGRLPLGADNMGGTPADVVTAQFADAVGQKGGSETKNINVENLPEHEHDLRDSEGRTFYAVREIVDLSPDPNVEDYPLPYGEGEGQAFPQTGGVLTNDDLGEPIDVMNPTLTLSYIIYTGRS